MQQSREETTAQSHCFTQGHDTRSGAPSARKIVSSQLGWTEKEQPQGGATVPQSHPTVSFIGLSFKILDLKSRKIYKTSAASVQSYYF